MIELYQFTSFIDKPDPSPFCVKVEVFMKVHNIEHHCLVGDARKAPKQKLPYIKDGDQAISDSDHIILYLTEKFKIQIDENLLPAEKAVAFSFRKTWEEYFYFALVYARWIDEEGWKNTRQLFERLPLPLRMFIPGVVRKSIKKTLHGQGIGRHSHEEIVKIANEVFAYTSSFLEDKQFIMGEQITSADITIFSFLTDIVNYHSFMTEELKKYDNLIAYEKRNFAKFYGNRS